MDTNGRPDDYAELFDRYFVMVRRICERHAEKLGGSPDDAEDLVQQVMLRFMEWDGLERYEPRKLHKTRDGFKTARFPTFLRAFASRFFWDLRDKYQRQSREVLTDFDAPGWEAAFAYRFDEDVETSVFIQTEMTSAWEHLGSVRLSEVVTAADVFDVMVEHATLDGKVALAPIIQRFSVSQAVASRWRRAVMVQLEDLGWPGVFAETY